MPNSQLILATFLATPNKTIDILMKNCYKKPLNLMGLNGFIDMPAAGFEPVTYALRVRCSTN